MAKYLAIHALQLASAAAGAIDSIPPGHRFESNSKDDIEALLKAGAIRKATDKDGNAPEVNRKSGDVAQPSSSNTVDGELTGTRPVIIGDDQLDGLKVDELKKMAGDLEIEGASGMKKDELVAAIKAKRAETSDDLV